jgi:hypothetical protein
MNSIILPRFVWAGLGVGAVGGFSLLVIKGGAFLFGLAVRAL